MRESFCAQETVVVRGRPLLIHTEHNAVRHLSEIIKAHTIDRVIFIYDPRVPRVIMEQCCAGLNERGSVFIQMPDAGETAKSLSGVQSLLDQVAPNATRDSGIVAVGGGVTSNAAGMVAGLLYRGVKLIHIPTTTLAQADAAIGLKQAVNSATSKNIYGLYHQPLAVLIDLDVTPTLPTSIIRDGLAEVAKVGLASSIEIYALLMKHANPRLSTILPEPELGKVVHLAAMAKLRQLPDDPYETDGLRLMELGHVAAHSLEVASHFTISHGTAVALGLVIEAMYSLDAGVAVDRELVSKFRVVLNDKLGFTVSISEAPHVTSFGMALNNSNKRGAHGIEITLPVRIGQTFVTTLTEPARLAHAYAQACRRAPS